MNRTINYPLTQLAIIVHGPELSIAKEVNKINTLKTAIWTYWGRYGIFKEINKSP
jgi:hypothetical protein